MAKRVSGIPPIVRAQRGASAATDHPTRSPKGRAPVRAASAKSVKAATKTPPTDDVSLELQAIFGENLKAARVKSGLNQRQLAALTGLSQQYLSQIEQGQQNVTLRTVELLAKVLARDVGTMLRRPKSTPEQA